MSGALRLLLADDGQRRTPIEVPFEQVVLVGYTGRDREAVMAHIRELEQLGVAPPPSVPAIYTVPPALVTLDGRLDVVGGSTSGEGEFVLIPSPDGLLVAVGSDHTDRAHEAIDVAESKALCGKVVSREVWPLAALEQHWDRLELRAWTTDTGGRRLYQQGVLGTLLTPAQLLAEVEGAGMTTTRALVFGGTLPTIGGFAFGSHFEVELHDPVLKRSLRCGYAVIPRAPQL